MIWPLVALEKVARIVGGGTPSRSEPRYWGEGHFWVTPTDLPMPGEGILELSSTKESITSHGLSSISANVLPIGTVLYSTRATIGKIAIANAPVVTNQGFNNLICGPEVYNRYLAYALQFFTPNISLLAGSTTFKEVARSSLRGFKIPVPPMKEQRRIVELLDQADALRRMQRDADAKAARVLPTLFLKMFGDPATNPMGWPLVPLSKVIKSIEAGWSAPSNGRPAGEQEFGVLKVSAVTSGRFRAKENKFVAETGDANNLITVKKGDLIFSRANTRELVAATCIVEEDHPNLFLPDKLWRLTPFENTASAIFLKELFWQNGMRDKFRASSSGSSSSMLNITQEAVLRTLAPIPPFAKQKEFESIACIALESIRQMASAEIGIEEIWSNLLRESFSGNITSKWREAHMRELLVEMQQQANALNLPAPKVSTT